MSIYADEGTAAHWVLEQCLTSIYTLGMLAKAEDYVGQQIEVRDFPHAELSPSSAPRWMACPGSVQMSRAFIGAELGEGPRQILFNQDYAQAVQEVLDYVERRIHEIRHDGGRLMPLRTERQVSPHPFLGTDACRGTVDVTLTWRLRGTPALGIEIIDAKFGAGTPVMPESKQLQLYLLGVLAEPECARESFGEARLTIAQPRCFKVSPTIRHHSIDVQTWKASFIEEVKIAIKATEQEPPILKPGEEQCRFCPARGRCSAATRHALTQATILEGGMPITADDLYDTLESFANLEPFLLTPNQMRAVLDGAEILEATLAAVRAHVSQLLRTGSAPAEITEAYKLVRANSQRRWTHDEDETMKRLKRIKVEDSDTGKLRALGKKDLVQTRLKSVKQVEDLLHYLSIPQKDARFDAFRDLVTKPEGALTLVPLSDKRPAVKTDQDPRQALEGGPDVSAPTEVSH